MVCFFNINIYFESTIFKQMWWLRFDNWEIELHDKGNMLKFNIYDF